MPVRAAWLAGASVVIAGCAGVDAQPRFEAAALATATIKGLTGEQCRPAGDAPLPAVVFVGGSEGGIGFAREGARRACAAGFAALALPYWRYDGLPDALEEIPISYFETAIDRFAAQDFIDADRVGLAGYSRGSEAAILTAAQSDTVAAVAGLATGAVAGPNIDFSDFFDVEPAWTIDGAPVAYVTLREDRPGADWRDMMSDQAPPSPERARANFEALQALGGFEASILPIAQIEAPVLLLGAGADAVWESCGQAAFLARRARPDQRVETLCLEAAPHDVLAPPDGAEADAPQAEAAWARVIAFFRDALGA